MVSRENFLPGEADTPWGDKWYFDYPCGVRDGWIPQNHNGSKLAFDLLLMGLEYLRRQTQHRLE